MDEPRRTMTRQELHDLVWSMPIQKLAEKYGLSDRGLAKTCQRYLVPVPGRGHWAKVAAGQFSKKSPLRAVENTELHTVSIGTRPALRQSAYLAEVLSGARAEIEKEDDVILDTPTGKEGENTQAMSEAGTSIELDPAIKPFFAAVRASGTDRDGFIPARDIRVTPSDLERIGRIISLLSHSLRRFGFKLLLTFTEDKYTTAGLRFEKDGTSVRFSFEARRKRITEESRHGYQSYKLMHVGRLTLEVFGSANGITKSWSDTDARKIERYQLNIVECVRLNFVANREREKQQEIERASKAHLAHRRKLAALRIKREADRLEFLDQIANARKECRNLRETIALVSSEEIVSTEYRKMIDWARARLATLEQQTSQDSIQAALLERELYTEPDNLLDPEGEPPAKVNSWDD